MLEFNFVLVAIAIRVLLIECAERLPGYDMFEQKLLQSFLFDRFDINLWYNYCKRNVCAEDKIRKNCNETVDDDSKNVLEIYANSRMNGSAIISHSDDVADGIVLRSVINEEFQM